MSVPTCGVYFISDKLFSGKVELVMSTANLGDCSVVNRTPESIGNIGETLEWAWADRHVHNMFLLNTLGSDSVINTEKVKKIPHEKIPLLNSSVILKPDEDCDGIFTDDPQLALGVLPADCPVIVIYAHLSGKVALLHGALSCLLPRGEDIIASALRAMGEVDSKGKPSGRNCSLWVGLGADKCCFGYHQGHENLKVVANNYASETPFIFGRVEKGPREGQFGLSLRFIVYFLARDYGFKSVDMSNSICTSCSREPLFFSNLRGHKERQILMIRKV